MQAVDLDFAISLPPEKAIEYFKSKGYRFSWNWRDMWQEAHDKAFTVAKVLRMDVLVDIRETVEKAMSEGLSLKEFQAELEPKLREKGWWGKKMVGDATGGQLVQLGSPRRLKTIYQTNLQTSYMAGRYKSFMDNADNRPFWQYVAIMDARTRPGHAQLNGRVFRFDDPFWESFYPPNGWCCRCRVRALSHDNVADRDLEVESSEGKLQTWADQGNGSKLQSRGVGAYVDPELGINVKTDPGWNYNPGKTSWQPDLDKYPPALIEQYNKAKR